jgi:hypothetical protein
MQFQVDSAQSVYRTKTLADSLHGDAWRHHATTHRRMVLCLTTSLISSVCRRRDCATRSFKGEYCYP